MKKMTTILTGIVLLLAACNKEKEKNAVTKENLVGTYKPTAIVSKLGNNPQEDELAQMEPCEKDDFIKLNTDNTCNVVDAGTVCNPNGSENGTWSLPSATQITILGETQTIKSFNGRTLVIEHSTIIFNNNYTYTTTLTKQ